MTKQSKKTAAIYDRWLSTLGGGEQVAFAYAETLRHLGYQTTLLTHKKISREKAEQKMGVNLHNISIKYLPVLSSKELSGYSEKYDLFINTSYLDYFANRSKLGILSVFFPGQIFLTPYEYLKRALVIPSFKAFFIYPTQFEGFAYDEYARGEIYKWLGSESSISFNTPIRRLEMTFHFQTVAFSVIESIHFYWGKREIFPKLHILKHNKSRVFYRFDLPQTTEQRFTIKLPDLPYANQVALLKLTIPDWRFSLYNLFKQFFPKWEMRLHGGPSVTKRSDLESYQKIITISEFCKKWIKKYWGLESQVLYPPVNTAAFSSDSQKKNHIIHIGRFFVTGHSKKQLDLVKVFKRLVDEKKAQYWELHFVGTIQEGQQHQEYFDQCRSEAKGYPIFFHTNANFDELKRRLSQSKIYWHATGLDENEEQDPILFEHFGITTVEAMASGCVPVVINAGGQKEIVTPESGFGWSNRKELISITTMLIKDPILLEKMGTAARERSTYFSRENFKKRFKYLIAN